MDLAERWNQRYQSVAAPPQAAAVLRDNRHLLPPSGEALDLACGLGGNALLLAEHGLNTSAWDISAVAIDKLNDWAGQRRLPIRGEVRDVSAHPPLPDSFDAIVVSRFLERALMPALQAALRPGGVLFYETFSRQRVDDSGPDNPAFRLADNELPRLLPELYLRYYRDEGLLGDTARGCRGDVLLIAQKPLRR